MHSNLVLPISWKLLLAQRNSMAALPTFGFTLDTLPFKMLRNSGQNPKWSNRIFRRRKYNNTSDYLVLSIKRFIFSLVHRWWQMTTDRNQTSFIVILEWHFLKAASWNWNWVWRANIFLHESPNVTVKCRTTKQCRSLVIERFVLF